MPELFKNNFIVGAIAFVAAVFLKYFFKEFDHKFGFVAKPKTDRWHKRPTAMLGGVSIFLTTAIISLIFAEHSIASLIILGSSSFLFVVGLIDDIYHIKPYQKLFGQIIGVTIIISGGLTLSSNNPEELTSILIPLWTNSQVLNILITSFWLVGITNAINLLDNMDGLAAGIAVIAALSLAFGFSASGQSSEVILMSIFVGALLGFLVFNFNPASIFMGDCGSMFVGFYLASSVLLTQVGGRSRGLLFVLAVPVLILFVPIFDTTFVTILRKLWGRKASQGGRDHTSHRLVALGLSEPAAVLMLYGFASLAGGLSLIVRELELIKGLALIAGFVLVLTIIGVYLAKVKVYQEQDEELALQNHAVFAFIFDFSYKRRIFEIFLDIFLISLAYYSAYTVLYGNFEQTNYWNLFIKSLPILIVLKLFAFLAVGVYRGIWRYTGLQDFFTFSKGVIGGSILSILAILLAYRFIDFSRTIFLLDAIFLFLGLAGSRIAFRLFRQLLPTPMNTAGRKVLIYGAGDGGEMVLRELHNNPEWNYNPIGFVDDDPLKKDKVIHGLPVFGGNGSLPVICQQNDVEEILISSRKISTQRISEIREVCENTDVVLKRAFLKIEPVDFE
jgi:UDP-GlcNAc:undecaprenyl-phosphate/decaprenyl-phosphate GlcNAc-1-phosphate transferase